MDKEPAPDETVLSRREELVARIESLGEFASPELRSIAVELAEFVRDASLEDAEDERVEALISRLPEVDKKYLDDQTRYLRTRKRALNLFEPMKPVYESLLTELMKWRVAALLTANSAGALAIISADRIPIDVARDSALGMLVGALFAVAAGTSLSVYAEAGLRVQKLYEANIDDEDFGTTLERLNDTLKRYQRSVWLSELALYMSLGAFAGGILRVVI